MGLFSSKDRGDKASPKTGPEAPKKQDTKAPGETATESPDATAPLPASKRSRGSQGSPRSGAGDDGSGRAPGAQRSSTDRKPSSSAWTARSPKGASYEKDKQHETTREQESAPRQASGAKGDKQVATLGQSIVFKGELSGDEDLEIEGQVEGNVHLANHQVTVGANGRLTAEVTAKTIIVIGHVKGNLTAAERIEIQATGVVEGDLKTPRLNVSEGAVLNGSIDMSGGASASASKPASTSAPTAAGSGGTLKSA